MTDDCAPDFPEREVPGFRTATVIPANKAPAISSCRRRSPCVHPLDVPSSPALCDIHEYQVHEGHDSASDQYRATAQRSA